MPPGACLLGGRLSDVIRGITSVAIEVRYSILQTRPSQQYSNKPQNGLKDVYSSMALFSIGNTPLNYKVQRPEPMQTWRHHTGLPPTANQMPRTWLTGLSVFVPRRVIAC